jgi:phage/plasmid-like protein (TIGR03299 family)
MPAEVETMFYAGQTPWHGLGVGVEKAKTSAQAIKLAGLDWTVEVGPVWAGSQQKNSAKPVPGRFAIFRTTDGKVYATNASDRYQTFQNSEAFDFIDSLLEDGIIHYETAGSLHEGARIWALARLEEGMRVGDDDYFQYMLLTSGHDLYGSIQILPTNVRVVCQNTLHAALAASRGKTGPTKGGRIKIAHQPGMKEKLQQAHDALRITTESNRRMQEWLSKLTTHKLTEQTVDAAVEQIFGPLDSEAGGVKSGQATNFRRIFAAEEERVGRTAYAYVNAITGYADHSLRYNGDALSRNEARMLSVIDGKAENFKEKGLAIIQGLDPKVGAPALV